MQFTKIWVNFFLQKCLLFNASIIYKTHPCLIGYFISIEKNSNKSHLKVQVISRKYLKRNFSRRKKYIHGIFGGYNLLYMYEFNVFYIQYAQYYIALNLPFLKTSLVYLRNCWWALIKRWECLTKFCDLYLLHRTMNSAILLN